VAAGEIEVDRVVVGFRVQVLCAQANDGIGALLQVAVTNIDIDDGEMCVLVSLLFTVIKVNRRASTLEREVAEPIGKRAGGHVDALVSLGHGHPVRDRGRFGVLVQPGILL
jgi:hypothetical protein